MKIVNMPESREIEARFMNIDADKIKKQLADLGATDLGKDILQEIIFYDQNLHWQKDGRIILRLRKNKKGVVLTFKDARDETLSGTKETEVQIDDFDKMKELLEKIGFVAYRHQEKKRHSFILGNVTLDLDSWPKIPTYLEIEGISETDVKNAANLLGLSWSNAEFGNTGFSIKKYHDIELRTMRFVTFDRFE